MTISQEISNHIAPALGTQKPLKVTEIVNSSGIVFQNLAPLRTALCSHDKGNKILPRLNEEMEQYHETLQLSLTVADNGISFSQDNAILYACLAEPSKYSDDEIMEYISDASEKAEVAHKEVTQVVSLVRKNRSGIVEVRNSLKNVNETVKEERGGHVEAKKAASQSAQHWDAMAKLISGASQFLARLSAHNRDKDELLIILPIILPVLEWGASEIRGSHEREVRNKELTIKRCDDVLKQLDTVIASLGELEIHLDHVAEWWISAQSQLRRVEATLKALKRPSKIRLRQLQGDFQVIGESFVEYKVEISKLLDYYTPN